jgi:hypothetical protein
VIIIRRARANIGLLNIMPVGAPERRHYDPNGFRA